MSGPTFYKDVKTVSCYLPRVKYTLQLRDNEILERHVRRCLLLYIMKTVISKEQHSWDAKRHQFMSLEGHLRRFMHELPAP